jgi:hypothetical protein
MTFKIQASLLGVTGSVLLAGCTSPVPSTDNAASSAWAGATAAQVAWPASLNVIGDGFPAAGAACRKIGESAATVNFLDDSATLVGCPTEADAAKLGGKIVSTVDGITLVSVPAAAAATGDGDGKGDAKVAGTDYNATAEIKCAGYRKHPPGSCPAGVKRNTEGGMTLVDITWPGGDSRALFFDKAGKLVTANTSQADGSAAFQPKGVKQGDMTIVTIGPERYEIPDVFLMGD